MDSNKFNGYTLIRNWYNFKFENPDKVRHIHSDMYCYLVDKWNRLGQKSKFGLPTMNTMELLGIGSYNTYKKALSNLIEWNFVVLVKDAKNQHQSKIIALSFFDKATDKPLDKATIIAIDEATTKATDSIIEPMNKGTNEQKNYIHIDSEKVLDLCDWFNEHRGIWAHDFPKRMKFNLRDKCDQFMLDKSQQNFNDPNHVQNSFIKFLSSQKKEERKGSGQKKDSVNTMIDIANELQEENRLKFMNDGEPTE